MSTANANFVVLSGPQKGQTLPIAGETVIVGRSGDCTIALQEDYVSRRQLELVLTAKGWLMENLSTNGTTVNGKRYKSGSKILLDTGDVLGVGIETQLLFVNAGDDPDAALQAHLAKEKPAPAAEAPAPAAAPATAPLPLEPLGKPLAAGGAPAPMDLPASITGLAPRPASQAAAANATATAPAPSEAAAKTAKYRKYGLLLAIYFIAMLGVIIYIAFFRPADDTLPDNTPRLPRLSATEIDQAIRERPKVSPDLTRATAELEQARGAFDSANTRKGKKYECIKHYKSYLAHRGSAMFEDLQDDQKYIALLEGTPESKEQKKPNGLIPAVQREYNRAVDLCELGRWSEAMAAFREVLALVPEQDPRDPTFVGLISNVNKWHELASSKLPKKK